MSQIWSSVLGSWSTPPRSQTRKPPRSATPFTGEDAEPAGEMSPGGRVKKVRFSFSDEQLGQETAPAPAPSQQQAGLDWLLGSSWMSGLSPDKGRSPKGEAKEELGKAEELKKSPSKPGVFSWVGSLMPEKTPGPAPATAAGQDPPVVRVKLAADEEGDIRAEIFAVEDVQSLNRFVGWQFCCL